MYQGTITGFCKIRHTMASDVKASLIDAIRQRFYQWLQDKTVTADDPIVQAALGYITWPELFINQALNVILQGRFAEGVFLCWQSLNLNPHHLLAEEANAIIQVLGKRCPQLKMHQLPGLLINPDLINQLQQRISENNNG